jgi:NADH:ubiquinone reductase (H+-translocating)
VFGYDQRVTPSLDLVVIGDTASLDQDGKPLPGVAQVAMQQGRYVGKLIRRRIAGKNGLRPFRYFDKGSMAVVGKGFAVLQSGTVQISGFMAWLAWAAVHLEFLAEHNLRVSVFVQWLWTFVTGQRGSRLIVDHAGSEPAKSIAAIAPSAAPASQPHFAAEVPTAPAESRLEAI